MPANDRPRASPPRAREAARRNRPPRGFASAKPSSSPGFRRALRRGRGVYLTIACDFLDLRLLLIFVPLCRGLIAIISMFSIFAAVPAFVNRSSYDPVLRNQIRAARGNRAERRRVSSAGEKKRRRVFEIVLIELPLAGPFIRHVLNYGYQSAKIHARKTIFDRKFDRVV